MSKVAKGKRRTRGKDGKTGKGAEEQDNESTYTAFKVTIRSDCSCFFIKAGTCMKKRKSRF